MKKFVALIQDHANDRLLIGGRASTAKKARLLAIATVNAKFIDCADIIVQQIS